MGTANVLLVPGKDLGEKDPIQEVGLGGGKKRKVLVSSFERGCCFAVLRGNAIFGELDSKHQKVVCDHRWDNRRMPFFSPASSVKIETSRLNFS